MAIDNIIIKGSKWRESDIETLFGDLEGNVEEVIFAESDEMGALMRELGVFPSANAARRAGREGPIPSGFTFEFKASKKRRLWIWNPTE
ncbi:hypothetical protein KAR91_76800 [Candidatus Pacearchaeota archaeon]|nr:hypothetical protein [Candidatus Pacearchaeota archaeon]